MNLTLLWYLGALCDKIARQGAGALLNVTPHQNVQTFPFCETKLEIYFYCFPNKFKLPAITSLKKIPKHGCASLNSQCASILSAPKR